MALQEAGALQRGCFVYFLKNFIYIIIHTYTSHFKSTASIFKKFILFWIIIMVNYIVFNYLLIIEKVNGFL